MPKKSSSVPVSANVTQTLTQARNSLQVTQRTLTEGLKCSGLSTLKRITLEQALADITKALRGLDLPEQPPATMFGDDPYEAASWGAR